jgi:hypothetical protein
MVTAIDIADLVFWTYDLPAGPRAIDAEADAMLLAMTVGTLPPIHRALIEHFGRAGYAPPWNPRQPGKVASLERARNARIVYVEWLRALTTLRVALTGALGAFRVTGPDAPREPWRRSA